MDITDTEKLRQNLLDAGCDDRETAAFFALSGTDIKFRQLLFLRRHRKQLLERLHEKQHEIECLDYLIMQIEKQVG